METVEIKVYSFGELSEDAKQNAIENLSDNNVDYSWWKYIYEDANNIGLEIDEFDLCRSKYCKGQLLYSASEVAANIFKEHGEDTSTYTTALNFMNDWKPIFDDYMNEESEGYESRDNENKMIDLESDFLDSLLKDYANMLQDEYEWLISTEAIVETIEANEYYFTEDGKLF